MLQNLLRLTLPSLLGTFLILELIFTFIIPANQFPYYYYDPDDRILRFSTTEQREGVHTIGLLAQQRAKWSINNAGWNSAVNFETSKHKPRIAIIGDSYVEAFQANVGDSLAGQLRKLVSPHFDVYDFGISGVPLSQYLQMARYVRTRFAPDILVINVVHNDFAESLCAVSRKVGMLCLEYDGQDFSEAPISAYQPNSMFRLARYSSLARYLVSNLQIEGRLQRLSSTKQNNAKYNANIDVDKAKSLKDSIRKATDYVLATMIRENGGTPMVFLMDAPRKDIYNGTTSESNVRWMHELLEEKTAQYGIALVDLSDEFKSLFEAEKVHFESEYDNHWNENGHRVAAYALYRKLRTLQSFQQTENEHGVLQ
ncbi:MAG: hypothetical protein CV089_05135 [Nitrospira sp. WS110]|nr:hypothetical protein [Nitrospira sp. WS110]